MTAMQDLARTATAGPLCRVHPVAGEAQPQSASNSRPFLGGFLGGRRPHAERV